MPIELVTDHRGKKGNWGKGGILGTITLRSGSRKRKEGPLSAREFFSRLRFQGQKPGKGVLDFEITRRGA